MNEKITIHTAPGYEHLWIFRGGYVAESINIDRTYGALDWCIRHKLKNTRTVTAENGEKFCIFKREKLFACAIPAQVVPATLNSL